MALQEPSRHPPKTLLAENALCFACMVGLLVAAAMSLQWVLHLLP